MKLLRFIVFLAATSSLAQNAPAPQISLGGNVGVIGAPILNSGTYQMPSDANASFTISNVNTSAASIKITSAVTLTATRNISYPAGKFSIDVENATTGGQSIQIIGASGTGVTIANGQTVRVWNDGTNFVQVGVSGGGGSGTVSGQAAGVVPLAGGATSITAQSHINENTSGITQVTQAMNVTGGISSGTPSSAATAAIPTGAQGFACDETSTAGVPAIGVDYIRCKSGVGPVVSISNGAEIALAVPSGTNTVQASNLAGTALGPTNPSTILNSIPIAEYSNTTRTAMANWLQALHNAATVPVNLAIGYDSFSVVCQANYSTGPATCADRYAEQLRIALQGQYGSHGTGIVPVIGSFNGSSTAIPNNLAWTVTGTYDTATISLGPTQSSQGGLVHLHSGAVATFSDSRGITFDTLKVYCMTNSSSGSIAVSIDSGAETGTACGTTSGSPTAALFSLSAGSNATHTVTFTSTGDSYLYAAQGTAGSSGVEVSNLAISGALASAFGATPTSELAFSDLNPTGTQGTIIMGQTNDAAASVTPSTFNTQMTSFITHQQGLGSSVMLAVPPPNSGDTGLTAPYTAVQVALAQTANVGFVNIQDQANWGTTYTASNLWSISGDAYPGIHPSNKGALSFFSMIYPTLVDIPPSGIYTPSAGGCSLNCTIGTASNSLTALTVNGGNATPAFIVNSTNNNFSFEALCTLSSNGFCLEGVGVSNTAHNIFYRAWRNTANPYGSLETFSEGDPINIAGSQQWLQGPVYIGNSNANGGATLPSGCGGLSIGTANQICFDFSGHINIPGAANLQFQEAGVTFLYVNNTGLGLVAPALFSWNGDTGLSRGAANTVLCGNDTAGDSSCTFKTAALFASGLGSSPSPICTTTGGQLTNSGCTYSIPGSPYYWNIQPGFFATGTMLGPIFKAVYTTTAQIMNVRMMGTISCTVAPVVNLMDLGTSPSTAYGSATSVGSLTTGTTDGVYATGALEASINGTHYYGIAFSAGTCATAPTFDISSTW